MAFDSTLLDIDPDTVAKRIEGTVRKQVPGALRRRGAVVAVSGGIDSSVCAVLCARALGGERVFALSLPERDSSAESTQLVQLLVATVGIPHSTHNITPILEAAGCYDGQEEAIRTVFPEYGPGWKCKIVMPPVLEGKRLNISRLEVEDPDGKRTITRLSPAAYLQLVAATNFKQRVRSMIAYYHADRLNYAVCGTPNRLEYDQGFFVKGGDGLADFKPIAHLYKTQVYQLGRFLGVPEGILCRPPTTETFSLTQSQEEFYFGLPYQILDVCLYAYNHGIPPAETAEATGLTPEQVEQVYADIQSKRRHTAPLHLGSLLCEGLPEVGHEERG